MKLFFYDLETTGLNPNRCGVHQIAGAFARLENGKLVFGEHFDFKVRPFVGKWVYPSALAVGGVSMDDLSSYQDPLVAFEKIKKMIAGVINKFDSEDKLFLVGYNNLHFDNDFLRQWFSDCGEKFYGSYFWSNGIDVMSEASRVLMGVRPYMKDFKLSTVAKTMGITVKEEELHDGLYDIRLTAMIFNLCLKDPSIRSVDGFNIGKMKEEVIASKEERKKAGFEKDKVETYLEFK